MEVNKTIKNNYRVKVESDFTDFYDSLSEDKSSVVYRRMKSDSISKNEAIRKLKNVGTDTVLTGAVKEIAHLGENLIIYTNDKNRKEKIVMESDYAVMMYPNYYSSILYKVEDKHIYSLVHIGMRRFQVMRNNKEVTSIKEIEPIINRALNYPIFSIDYIITKKGMVATGYNNILNLGEIGMQEVITAQEVIDEIYKSIKIGGLGYGSK